MADSRPCPFCGCTTGGLAMCIDGDMRWVCALCRALGPPEWAGKPDRWSERVDVETKQEGE